jgi:cardiolipin synthase
VVITTPYFIPDEALLLAMETAVMRGVEVHLVLSAKADQILVGLAQRSFYGGLLRAGVHIHLYKKRFLHAKHLSIDDSIVVIGSSNMDIRSFTLNAEISMIVYDKQIAAELRAIQDRYFAKAERLTLEKWQKRWFLAKLLQNTARLVDSLL